MLAALIGFAFAKFYFSLWVALAIVVPAWTLVIVVWGVLQSETWRAGRQRARSRR
jgi:hypothetical protein